MDQNIQAILLGKFYIRVQNVCKLATGVPEQNLRVPEELLPGLPSVTTLNSHLASGKYSTQVQKVPTNKV